MKYLSPLSPTPGVEKETRYWRCSSLSLASCSTPDLSSKTGWPFLTQILGTHLYGRDRGCTPGASRVDQKLIFNFEHIRSFFFRSLQISLHVLFHRHPGTEAFVPTEEHKVGTKNVTVRSESHHIAHQTHSVVSSGPREHIVSKAGLASLTVSALGGFLSTMLTFPDKAKPFFSS